jgi:hypothetical protein
MVCVNKYLKFLIRTAIAVIDQSTAQADRASESVSGLIDRSKEMIQPPDRRLHHALSFAAGIGVGVGAAFLMAPSSGEQLRGSIKDSIKDKFREIKGQ